MGEHETRFATEEFDFLLASVMPPQLQALDGNELVKYMSVLQGAFDRCLNEYERRGLLQWSDGVPVIPFDVPDSRFVETVLTRP